MEFNGKAVDLLYRMVLQYGKSLVLDSYGVQVMSLTDDEDDFIFLADTIEGMVQNLPYKTNSEQELEWSMEDLRLMSPDMYYKWAVDRLRVHYEVKLLLGEHELYNELNEVLVQLNDLANIEIDVEFEPELKPSFEIIIPEEFAVPVDDDWMTLKADEITGQALYNFYVDRNIGDIDTSSIYGAIILNSFKNALKYEGDVYSLADVIEDIVEELDGIIPHTIELESEEVLLCSRAMKDGLLFNQFGDMLNGEEQSYSPIIFHMMYKGDDRV